MNIYPRDERVFAVRCNSCFFFFFIFALFLSAGPVHSEESTAESSLQIYVNERPVSIEGYDGEAMEPFLTRDGRYLFFNSRNDTNDTNLYFARRKDDATFKLG